MCSRTASGAGTHLALTILAAAIIIPTFPMRKLEPRGAKTLAQGHVTAKGRTRNEPQSVGLGPHAPNPCWDSLRRNGKSLLFLHSSPTTPTRGGVMRSCPQVRHAEFPAGTPSPQEGHRRTSVQGRKGCEKTFSQGCSPYGLPLRAGKGAGPWGPAEPSSLPAPSGFSSLVWLREP